MEESIRNFAKQFDYKPEIKNVEKLGTGYKNFVLAGMGGSHLSAGILKTYKPDLNLYIHLDYGVPEYTKEFCRETLFIASSYSGNTEEVMDFLDESYSKGHEVLIISTGGKLIDFAKDNKLPYIQLPKMDIQPRLAVGYSTIALAMVVLPQILPELLSLAKTLNPQKIETQGNSIAESLFGKIPVIYSSNTNRYIAYNWKIKYNETAKIPAFCNVFPELNHNEMQGYDFIADNEALSKNFHFIILKDNLDDERVTKRMDVLQQLFEEKGLGVTEIYLNGNGRFEQIFNSLILADWVTINIAKKYNIDPDKVPLIEKFKKKIS
jgi:glucose/mannose-6-phosphate isomerase